MQSLSIAIEVGPERQEECRCGAGLARPFPPRRTEKVESNGSAGLPYARGGRARRHEVRRSFIESPNGIRAPAPPTSGSRLPFPSSTGKRSRTTNSNEN